MPPQATLGATLLILVAAKILYIYNTKQIFFPKFYGILHLMSYLCALEALPLLTLWVTAGNIADTYTI